MIDRREKAVELKHNGYNCCQAVLCAFADELPLAEDNLKRIGAAYGVGMGCMEATCGALCAAEMILGMKKYEGSTTSGGRRLWTDRSEAETARHTSPEGDV